MWAKKSAMKIFGLVVLVLPLLLTACASGGGNLIPTPTPNLEATVQAAVASALPTETPTPTPDINATVAASMSATMTAMPRPTPASALAPTWTPVPTWTPEPTPTAVPIPTSTVVPIPVPTPTPTAPAGPTLGEIVGDARPAVVRISSLSGTGTGVIFDVVGQTAYIVTNQHVVENQVFVNVTVGDSSTYQGTVLGADPLRDLAVVRICCGDFTSLAFGDSTTLEIGAEVVTMGYALGLEGSATVTKGIVSALRYDSVLQADVIQTDAPISSGHSGGPMLSLSGLVLGINTYSYTADQGAEGLHFAISAETVLERLPVLRVGSPPSTPLPTLSAPTPTSRPLGVGDWGPISGELWHNPAADFIKTEYAGVLISDMIVEATFVNPYSSSTDSWDYGFTLRDREYGSFLQFVVSSDRRWDVKAGADPPYDVLESGTLSSLETGVEGQNHLMVVAIGERGWFFVNGDFIADVDLSDVTHSGDVAVITGAYVGDERAGSVTRYENFRGRQLSSQYGPASGKLEYEGEDSVSLHGSGIWARDLIAEATFLNPQGNTWSYGFIIRNPEFNRAEVIGIADGGWWFHETLDVGDYDYTEVSSDNLPMSVNLGGRNHLLLIAVRDSGWLFVDGQFISKLSLGHNHDHGIVSVVGDFWIGDRGEPEFQGFNVWAP